MEYSPKKVGSFYCDNNCLIILNNCPEINGDFNCSYNQLISLKNSIKEIHGDFNCSGNQLISLEGGPNLVADIRCNNNLLTIEGLKYLPKSLNDFIEIFGNKNLNELQYLNSLKELKEKVETILNIKEEKENLLNIINKEDLFLKENTINKI